jgi:hypothetical protein
VGDDKVPSSQLVGLTLEVFEPLLWPGHHRVQSGRLQEATQCAGEVLGMVSEDWASSGSCGFPEDTTAGAE